MRIKSAEFAKCFEAELLSRRRKTKAIMAARSAEIHEKIPEIAVLERDINAIAFDMGRQIMESGGKGNAVHVAETLLTHKEAERAHLLIENGYPADYLDTQYICPDCRDSGKVGSELCHCVTQMAVNLIFSSSGLNPDECFKNYRSDIFTDEKQRNAMVRICDLAVHYSETFPNVERKNLFYFGPSGVGKTFLLNCIGGRLVERGFSVLKISAFKLIRITMDSLRSDALERPDFTLPEVLIIDDLGAEPMIPNITLETLLSVICERQDAGKATLIATNLRIESTESTPGIQDIYGERLSSRLIAPRIVSIQEIRSSNLRLIPQRAK